MQNNLLSGQLDELAQKRDPFAEIRSKDHLRDDPELDLVEAAQKHVQVGGNLPKLVAAKHLVDQLILQTAITKLYYRRHLQGFTANSS